MVSPRRDLTKQHWALVFAAISVPHACLFGAFAGRLSSQGFLARENAVVAVVLFVCSIYILYITTMVERIANLDRPQDVTRWRYKPQNRLMLFFTILLLPNSFLIVASKTFTSPDNSAAVSFMTTTLVSWGIWSFVTAILFDRHRKRMMQRGDSPSE